MHDKNNHTILILNMSIIILLFIVAISGILSFNSESSYSTLNQYGESINIWGYGVYSHDSFFKAPIFIGTDLIMLVLIVPSLVMLNFNKHYQQNSVERDVRYLSILGVVLYYSVSLAFGVVYNSLHLIYIALFSISFFYIGYLIIKIYTQNIINKHNLSYKTTKGMSVFLIISGIILLLAWIPDILSSLIHNTPLSLIEIYTTETTNVLDIGIVCPLIFITLSLIRKKSFLGYALLRMILKLCIVIGIILPAQSILQIISGIEIPIEALITKVLGFVLLSIFAYKVDNLLKKSVEITI